ncbi:MAG: hypothetical protein AAGB46_08915 [Verrucomicrobiota bacterium]
MRYVEFRDSIEKGLKNNDAGMTWRELKEACELPYERPCPEWVAQLERELGLERQDKRGNALVWKLSGK